jgi:hypothetical protein
MNSEGIHVDDEAVAVMVQPDGTTYPFEVTCPDCRAELVREFQVWLESLPDLKRYRNSETMNYESKLMDGRSKIAGLWLNVSELHAGHQQSAE